MRAAFVELSTFDRRRSGYLDDEQFRQFQVNLLRDPECGEVIGGTGGLRKMRFGDARRGKGKRSGLRIIYFWWRHGAQFWLFTIYDKNEMEDLSPRETNALKQMLEAELEART